MTTVPTRGLLDGDIIVYRVGFASQDVSENIALARVDSFIDNVMVGADLTTVSGYITGTKDEDPRVFNYRELIAVSAPYKGTRSGDKPKHYAAIRRHLQVHCNFSYQYDQEADDAIAIEATQYRDDVVICSIDKDLRQVPGFHYNFVNGKVDYVTDEEGNRFFYRQILTGDRIDNVPGLDGIGPVKAKKIIPEDIDSPEAMWLRVVDAYGKHFPKLPVDKLHSVVVERGQLLWLRRYPGQLWEPPVIQTFKELK